MFLSGGLITDVNKQRVTNNSRKLKEYPPDNLDLSDAWVVAVVDSKLSREERGTAWPTVFTNRGALRAQYMHKGQAAKLFDLETKGIKYALLFGKHNMIGAEGMKEGLPTRRPTVLADAEPVTHGLLAQVQDLTYDEKEAESEATAARKAATPAVMKKIVTARSTGFTAINSTQDGQESEGDSEDEAPEDLFLPYRYLTQLSHLVSGKE